MKFLVVSVLIAGALGACSGKASGGGVTPQKMADVIYTVISADRSVYTREVVNRLQNDEKVIRASAHFREERTLPLPAQMFRMAADAVHRADAGVTYALLSLWPVSRQNAPATGIEREGLKKVAETGANFYGEETLGGRKYFTAVYPDKATSAACVKCHNENPDSPRSDFKVGDVMGGVVIRIAIQ